MISRRTLLKAGSAGLLMRSHPLRAASARVVIVGGGFAGAACARRLRASCPNAEVILIERRRSFYTGPFCNAVASGMRPLSFAERTAQRISDDGVQVRFDEVVEIDPVVLRVRTASGLTLPADFIVVAPGVAMRWDTIEGLDERTQQTQPHAWLGDAQIVELKRRLDALEDGSVIAIASPPNPYRCPPGPYERASLIAWNLMQRRHRRSRILIFDSKDDFTKKPLFEFAWDLLYPGLIRWHSRAEGASVVAVDPRGRWLRSQSGERTAVDLACTIPPQRAADIALRSDLVDDTLWCPVHVHGLESKRHSNVFVLGDAAALAPVPKSAFAAHSQAQLCALTIAARIQAQPAPTPRLINTCYSLLADQYAISVSAVYAPSGDGFGVLHSGMSPLQANADVRRIEYQQAQEWYAHITAACFGDPGFT